MLEIFTNSIMQSFIFSPLMGVFFGALFAGLSKNPTSSRPVTVIETRRVYIERYRSTTRSNKSDGGEIFGVAFILMLIVWKYLQVAPIVLNYIQVSLITMISFGLTCFLVSAIKGHFMSNDWLIRVALPTVALIICYALLVMAKEKITPELIDLAIHKSAIEFFISLTDYWRYYVILHVIGLCFLTITAFINTFSMLHYLALMNLQEQSLLQGFWSAVARITDKFSGKGTYFATVTLLALALLSINGQLALWIMPSDKS